MNQVCSFADRARYATIAFAIALTPRVARAQGQFGADMAVGRLTMSDLGSVKIPQAQGFYGGFEGSFLASFAFHSRQGIVATDAAWLLFDVSGTKGAAGTVGYELLAGYRASALELYVGGRIGKYSAHLSGSSQRGTARPLTAKLWLRVREGDTWEEKYLVVSAWGGSWGGPLQSSGARFVWPFSAHWSLIGHYERTTGPVDYATTTVAGRLTILALGVQIGFDRAH